MAENSPGKGAVNPEFATAPSSGAASPSTPVLRAEDLNRLRAADFRSLRRIASLDQVAALVGVEPQLIRLAATAANLPMHVILGTPLLFRDELVQWVHDGAEEHP